MPRQMNVSLAPNRRSYRLSRRRFRGSGHWLPRHHAEHPHLVRGLGKADVESAQLDFRPRVDAPLHLDGRGRVARLAERVDFGNGRLALFAVQLALNAAWSWLFFGFHLPGAAFFEIVALLVAIVGHDHRVLA